MTRRVNLGADDNAPDAPAKNIRMYVFNQEETICMSIVRFLLFMGAKPFDPFNISLMPYLTNMEPLVLIHNKDQDKIERIPNLLKLKQHPKVRFALYESVFDVKHRNYKFLMEKGGVLVPDDRILSIITPDTLVDICEYMELQMAEGINWSFKVRTCTLDQLDETRKLKSRELGRILDMYSAKGVVEYLNAQDFGNHPRPPEEYMSVMIALQQKYAAMHRHFYLLSDMPESCPIAQIYARYGLGVISPAKFSQTFMTKEPGPEDAPVIPEYRQWGERIYQDYTPSSTTETITVDIDPNTKFDTDSDSLEEGEMRSPPDEAQFTPQKKTPLLPLPPPSYPPMRIPMHPRMPPP